MKLYLAYGANTNLESMRHRCPAAQYVCNITLHHHRLVFRGVADVVPNRGSKVVCAMWIITPECERALDRFEGFPNLYVKRYVTVHLQGKRHRVMFYVMTRPAQRGESEPSSGYEETLRVGYAECGMPIGQIDRAIGRAKAWKVAHAMTSTSAYISRPVAAPMLAKPVVIEQDEEMSDEAEAALMAWYEEQSKRNNE